MNNTEKFQTQLEDLIYDISNLTTAIDYFRNNFIKPDYDVDVKDLVMLINIIHSYSQKVQNNAKTIDKAQINFFSEYNETGKP